MNSRTCFLLISYDIAEDRRRAKVAKLLEDHGLRIQESLFECRMDWSSWRKLELRLLALLDEAEDSLQMYPICAACRRRGMYFGKKRELEDGNVIFLI